MILTYMTQAKTAKIIEKNPSSPWAPLRYHVFKMLWIASVISNIGTWMHEVGAAWLMTSLSTKPLWVALIQTTTSLSIFLFALPGGIIADIIDKRRYLIVLQTSMMLIAGTLACLTFLGKMTPELLLFLTFFLGTGAALSVPTWQAVVPELVPEKMLFTAITLNGVGINVARAIGPAIAGAIIAAAGPAAVFAINTASFLGIIIALVYWQRKPLETTLPAERFFGAMRAGIRYVSGSPVIQNVLIRASSFFLFASATWALLPLVARIGLHQGPTGYGILFALLGIGAVFAAFFLPKIRQYCNVDQLVLLGSLIFASTIFILAISKNFYLACVGMLGAGIAWMMVLAALNTTAQQASSSWIRARVLSAYFMVFFGNMAIGSIVWGAIANYFGLSISLLIASGGLVITSLLCMSFSLEQSQELDLSPSKSSPAPVVEAEPEYEQGPIMVTIEYDIGPNNITKFNQAMRQLRLIRRRDGAFFWNLFNDITQPKRFVECFMVESWLEHLRQHERLSVSDQKIIARTKSLHEGKKPPLVSHFVAHELPKKIPK